MGKTLNKNNFLTWKGEFIQAPSLCQAVDDDVQLLEGSTFAQIYPLANDSATYGIAKTTLEITFQDNADAPATWDDISQQIIYYPPVGVVVGDIRQLRYRWRDSIGNYSNEATINITISARPTGWRGYDPSIVCETSGGDNTGNANYTQLEKIYTDTNTPVIPQVLKDNGIDADAIAPFADNVLCPLPGATVPAQIWNIGTGFLGITRVLFTHHDGTLFDFSGLAIYPGVHIDVMIKAGEYDSILVETALGTHSYTFVILAVGPGSTGDQSLDFDSGTNSYIFTTSNLVGPYGATVLLN